MRDHRSELAAPTASHPTDAAPPRRRPPAMPVGRRAQHAPRSAARSRAALALTATATAASASARPATACTANVATARA